MVRPTAAVDHRAMIRAKVTLRLLVAVMGAAFFACACDSLKGRSDADGGGMSWTPTTPASSSPQVAAASSTSVVTLAPASEGVWGVTIDAANVYYSTMVGDQGIRRRARTGNGASSLVCKVADSMQSPQTVFVDATHVYVITTALGTGAVYRAKKDASGGNCEKVATGAFLTSRGITKIGDTVYVGGGGNKGFILAVDAAGKSRTIAEPPSPVDGLTTDGTSLFYGAKDATGAKLMKIAPTGGAAVELGKGGLGVRFAGGRLYFVGAGLTSLAPTGGEPKMIGKPAALADFAVVGTRVYGGGNSGVSGGYVSRGAVDSADLTRYATLPGGVVTMAADERDVYVTLTDKTLVRLSP